MALREAAKTTPVGLMIQPENYPAAEIGYYRWWAADNGCYSKGDQFNAETWVQWLYDLPRDRCLFVVAPDVVADADATLKRSRPWLPCIRALGFPAAYAAQDGIVDAPWDEIDVLFIGGSTKWKTSPAAYAIVAEARRRGKWVHMGRVNSLRRLRTAELMGCQSADGTYLRFRGRGGRMAEAIKSLVGWLDRIHVEPFLPYVVPDDR